MWTTEIDTRTYRKCSNCGFKVPVQLGYDEVDDECGGTYCDLDEVIDCCNNPDYY